MAAAILRSGAEVAVFDVRPEAMARYVALGATAADSLADLARLADIVTITVLDGPQLESVVRATNGHQGLLATMAPGGTIVVHSTVDPELCRCLAAEARVAGVGFVDAPVSGSEQGAIDGTLTVMVGGSDEDVERCQRLFQAIGTAVHHLGDVGAGQVGKAVNNMIGIATRIAVREGLELARSAGLDDDVVLGVVRQSTGNSYQVEHWWALQAAGARATGGPAGLAAIAKKDIDLALGLAAAADLDLPVSRTAAESTAGLFGPKG